MMWNDPAWVHWQYLHRTTYLRARLRESNAIMSEFLLAARPQIAAMVKAANEARLAFDRFAAAMGKLAA